MPGPLPESDGRRRRRNTPTIPTTELPLLGREGRAPRPPKWIRLGKAGKAWWEWAWATPQATAWGDMAGQEAFVARRASLEDDLAALESVTGLDWHEAAQTESDRQLRLLVSRVAAMATGRLALIKEMREMDDRLGLTPKGLAALRWRVVASDPADEEDPADEVAQRRKERRDRVVGQ